MGRTVPSFRIQLDMEKEEWKPFRAALDKSERKEIDDMWDIPRLYVTACSNSVSLVPLHPIMISILFHHYKELMQLEVRVEKIESKMKERGHVTIPPPLPPPQLQQNKEEKYTATTSHPNRLDRYFYNNGF